MSNLVRTHIVVHHSLTTDGATVSWKAIEDYHRNTQGWLDIGYHAGVELVGDHHFALLGRDLGTRAAAVKEQDMNGKALHVCCVGNYDELPPQREMLVALINRVLRPWMSWFNIPARNVRAHRDFAPYKSCPGKLFNMDELRGLL